MGFNQSGMKYVLKKNIEECVVRIKHQVIKSYRQHVVHVHQLKYCLTALNIAEIELKRSVHKDSEAFQKI
ncbi:unnamed protein product, partial [Soboliphyme baturini]|uniref:Transposase n=1 Tax=Soboliphyme baturini TaxID=241478 RepID=A0A183JAL3_9BILA